MITTAAQLRTMHVFYHQAHHMVKGSSFFGDHEALLGFYKQLEDSYDSVVERTIMLTGPEYIDLKVILNRVENTLAMYPPLHQIKDNKEIFIIALDLERELCAMCQAQIEHGTTEGTKQLLGDICNQSEMRQYKIDQRIR